MAFAWYSPSQPCGKSANDLKCCGMTNQKKKQGDYNAAVLRIPSILEFNIQSGSRCKNQSWRLQNFFMGERFKMGVANFSPGWFMQGHEVLFDCVLSYSDSLIH